MSCPDSIAPWGWCLSKLPRKRTRPLDKRNTGTAPDNQLQVDLAGAYGFPPSGFVTLKVWATPGCRGKRWPHVRLCFHRNSATFQNP